MNGSEPKMVEKEENKKLRFLVVLLLLIVVGLSMFMLGQFLSNKNNTTEDNKRSEESSLESGVTKEENGSQYKNKIFYKNSKKDEYIKFTSEKNYEYKHRSFETNDILVDNGTYTVNGNSIVFDNGERSANVFSNYIELVSKDNAISDSDYMYYLYFEEDKLMKNNELISSALEKYMKKFRDEDSALPEVTKVDNIDVGFCYRYNDEANKDTMHCISNYSVYVKDYDKDKCDKYITYGGAGAECEESYIHGSGFFSLEKNNGTFDIKGQFSAP